MKLARQERTVTLGTRRKRRKQTSMAKKEKRNIDRNGQKTKKIGTRIAKQKCNLENRYTQIVIKN
jgi:ribosomal protein L44E